MERIVTVDENDNVLGEEDKEKCHDGGGLLHRAFLAMVLDDSGKLLITRRSGTKRLWPGFWDGTVASHLFRGENYEEASKRRLSQELGLITDTVDYLFKFHYTARYGDIGTENEICAVTLVKGIDIAGIVPNRDEISDVAPIALEKLIDDLGSNGDHYTPWLALAIKHMKKLRMW
ncbi:MAG: NUDIX domain-containing protein [Nitrospirae bacterium]|nr:NUDIX domain-containing protein [Nitrospirota bacterium]